jgi:hypothetical protein
MAKIDYLILAAVSIPAIALLLTAAALFYSLI